MPLLRDRIDIPESVPASRFVVSLSQGVLDPQATLGEYVVTPQLAECFDKALALIQNSLANRASSGTYLHGSFGSGKSHFMAVLSLILLGEPKARGIPELADIIAKHNAWLADSLAALPGLSDDDFLPTIDAEAVSALKFSDCLPRAMATRMLEIRSSDLPAIRAVLAEPTRRVVTTQEL